MRRSKQILKYERKVEDVEAEMMKHAADYGKLSVLSQEKEELSAKLLEKMDRWEYLSELAERIAAYKS
ncbi:MAG: ABC transporter C-terminal domain-containing protein [Emergencia sp.]